VGPTGEDPPEPPPEHATSTAVSTSSDQARARWKHDLPDINHRHHRR